MAFATSRESRDAHSLERAMGAVVAEFEAMIREFPSQWFQFAPFWPEDVPITPQSTQRGTEASVPLCDLRG